MEEARVKTRVNVLAINDNEPHEGGMTSRVIRVQKAFTEISGLKYPQVCLGIEKPDDEDPEDVGTEKIYLFIEKLSELDKLILALQLLKVEIYARSQQ